MDAIAGTGLETERPTDTHPAALLVIVLDTNPFAWSELSPHLTLSKTISDLLIFMNAHLASNHANRVAVLASHCRRSVWLYPSSPLDTPSTTSSSEPPSDPNKYRPFAAIEHELLHNLRALVDQTTAADLDASPTSTTLSGSLTLALSYISKLAALSTGAQPVSARSANARVLLVSTSGDLAGQYIPLMNVVFAAQHLRIPLDILKLSGDAVLLQQASYTTSGVFLVPASIPAEANGINGKGDGAVDATPGAVSILPTLLFAFLSDPQTRKHLVPATALNVDFRAACFCHRRVVDIGYVCSICLSIFCTEGVAEYMQGAVATGSAGDPVVVDGLALAKNGATCLTCGTKLSLRALGGAQDEKPRKKKKKKRREEGEGTPANG